MWYLLIALISLFCLKLIINGTKYIQCNNYLEKYGHWLLKKRDWKLVEHKATVIKLFKDANIEDSMVSHVELAGYGMVGTANVSVFENFPNQREDMATHTIRFFHEAKGVYRSRFLETFSPLYWIDFIIHLPQKILEYLGANPEGFIVKLAQVCYWAISGIIALLYAVFKTEIHSIIKSFLTK